MGVRSHQRMTVPRVPRATAAATASGASTLSQGCSKAFKVGGGGAGVVVDRTRLLTLADCVLQRPLTTARGHSRLRHTTRLTPSRAGRRGGEGGERRWRRICRGGERSGGGGQRGRRWARGRCQDRWWKRGEGGASVGRQREGCGRWSWQRRRGRRQKRWQRCGGRGQRRRAGCCAGWGGAGLRRRVRCGGCGRRCGLDREGSRRWSGSCGVGCGLRRPRCR